ncbi:site-specific integrase, partial [Salmonella enterica]|uniref:site-specific integrase n=1 Tax=Salmonella enterica TaxID=28901 RepID=UPI0032B52B78
MAGSDPSAPRSRSAARREGEGEGEAERTVRSTDPHLDRFIDMLWLEDGLSPNTLSAYRRDLSALAGWLGEHGGATLAQA